MARISNAVEEAAENAVEAVVDAVETVETSRYLNKYTLAGFVGGVVLFGGAVFVIKKVRDAKAAKAVEATPESE